MKLHEKRQKRNNIATQMRALHEEIGDSAWTDEQRTKWDGMRSELDTLESSIQREEQLQADDQRFVESQESEQRDETGGDTESEYRQAFGEFMRNGLSDMDSDRRQMMKEKRALAAGTDSAGGYTVPTAFRNTIIETMAAYGGVASVCQILDTNDGQMIEWPTTDGTADLGELIGENGEANEGDVVFGTANVGAKKISSKIIRVPNELLNDSGIDMEAFLARRIASRIGRKEAQLAIQGTGTGTPLQPKGLAASVTLSQPAGAAAVLTHTDLVNLKHKVDPAYRQGPRVRFGFNDTTLKSLKLLSDSEGRPLWLPSIAGVAPATIDGDEFFIDQAIDDVGSSNKSVFYGDFMSFVIRRVRYMALKRLTERYAEFDQTGFLAFHRMDCVLEDTAAIASLTHPA